MKTIEHWIDGKPTAGTSGRTAPVYNPAAGAQQAACVTRPEGSSGHAYPGASALASRRITPRS